MAKLRASLDRGKHPPLKTQDENSRQRPDRSRRLIGTHVLQSRNAAAGNLKNNPTKKNNPKNHVYNDPQSIHITGYRKIVISDHYPELAGTLLQCGQFWSLNIFLVPKRDQKGTTIFPKKGLKRDQEKQKKGLSQHFFITIYPVIESGKHQSFRLSIYL